MTILFRCPACGHKLRASDGSGGRRGKCKCGHPIVVPGGEVGGQPGVENGIRSPVEPSPSMPYNPPMETPPEPPVVSERPRGDVLEWLQELDRRNAASSLPELPRGDALPRASETPLAGRRTGDLPVRKQPRTGAAEKTSPRLVWPWLVAGSGLALLLLIGSFKLLGNRSRQPGNEGPNRVASASQTGAEEKTIAHTPANPEKPDDGKDPGVAVESGTGNSKSLEKKDPDKAAPIVPVIVTGSQVREAMSKQVVLTGSVQQDSRTQSGFNSSTTFHQWVPKLRLENQSAMPIEFGSNFLLFELNADSSILEGVAVFLGTSSVTTPSTYGMYHNWETNGNRMTISGSMYHMSFGAGGGSSFGSVQPGKTWQVERVLEQGTWMRDELRTGVLIVLPEARVKTKTGIEKFRTLAYFQKPTGGKTWALGNQRLIPLEKDGLQKMLEAPESTLVMRILSANFLAESHPGDAAAPLAAVAKGLNEGDLLATCLDLMTNLKGAGLGPHALTLLQKKTAPNGIRDRAARHLGAIQYAPALDLLISTARDNDRNLASAAIAALGDFGGPRAVDALLGMLKDARSDRHNQVAANLARTKDPRAIAALKELAGTGNPSALDALVDAGLPETFAFFVDLSKKARSREERDKITRGLRKSGKEKAFPVLLEMLEADTLAAPKNTYDVDTLVQELATLVTPTTQQRIVALARAGNLRAVQVLAQSKDESVWEPLTELSGKTTGVGLRIVMHGLSQNWPKKSADVFAKALGNPDEEVVQSAIRGLEQSKDTRTVGLLLPLLGHNKEPVRRAAGWSMQQFPAGDKIGEIAQALLKTTDDQLVAGLVKMLIDGKWQDKSAIPKLGDKLRTAKDYTRYEVIRLLRHLSNNAMGPNNSTEYYQDPEGWARKWIDWAKK